MTPLTRLPRPSLANKLARAGWLAVCLVLFRPSPVPLHAWRRALLRLFGAQVGAGALVYPSARVWAPWNLELGEGSCLGPASEAYNVAQIVLGPGAVVSQRAYLCTATHAIREPGFALMAAPIVLGTRAWVAAAAYVGPGVTLADGAVAAACAVVVKDVARDQVVGGNPARPIGEGALSRQTGGLLTGVAKTTTGQTPA